MCRRTEGGREGGREGGTAGGELIQLKGGREGGRVVIIIFAPRHDVN
jgi:hypothetical protein